MRARLRNGGGAIVLLTTLANRLFSLGIPITEKIVRTVVVYGALLVLFRIGGKRTAAQLNTFDLVVLLLISNVVQNAIIGPDNSLLGGLIGATALVVANDLITRFVRRSDLVDRAMEGNETRLVEDGAFLDPQLRRLGIRTADLEVALRRQGAENVHQVERADLYPTGAVVVDLRPKAHGASLGDIERLERKLDQLTASVDRLAQADS
jgi:uncharacterized membrane protein YcaP (DUF421 family)